MSIREYLQGRARKFLFMLPLLFLCALLATEWVILEAKSFTWLVVIPFLLYIFFTVYYLKRFRCPECEGRIPSLIGHFGPLRKMAKPVKYCPFCAVDLDSDMP